MYIYIRPKPIVFYCISYKGNFTSYISYCNRYVFFKLFCILLLLSFFTQCPRSISSLRQPLKIELDSKVSLLVPLLPYLKSQKSSRAAKILKCMISKYIPSQASDIVYQNNCPRKELNKLH